MIRELKAETMAGMFDAIMTVVTAVVRTALTATTHTGAAPPTGEETRIGPAIVIALLAKSQRNGTPRRAAVAAEVAPTHRRVVELCRNYRGQVNLVEVLPSWRQAVEVVVTFYPWTVIQLPRLLRKRCLMVAVIAVVAVLAALPAVALPVAWTCWALVTQVVKPSQASLTRSLVRRQLQHQRSRLQLQPNRSRRQARRAATGMLSKRALGQASRCSRRGK